MLPAIAASSNGTIVAIASRERARAVEMAAGFTGVSVLESYEAVLADKRVDAVYIPLVNDLHREWTLRALAAGKHVLCEKPLAMNAGEAEDMAAAARSAGRLLMEAFMYRFHPRVRALVDAVRDPMHVQASFGFRLDDAGNYRLSARHGGGALLDVGCYVVSVARWILGEPDSVLAVARVPAEVDMTTSALLRFDGGATAALWASFESPEQQELTVVTPGQALRLAEPFTSHEGADPYRLMVESFAESVLGDRPVAIPLSESIANMRVLDRIRIAASSS